jgi:hypothetical protein
MFHFLNGWRESFAQDDMADLVAPEFSKRQVVEAGARLKGQYPQVSAELLEAFKIAHNWRACHILPMRHLRAELVGKVKKVGGDALTAARLKRMASIRAKLRRAPHNLYQMQDIGGCRAIVADQNAVNALLALYRSEPRHVFVKENDYIANPRASGYRSHHLVYRFQGHGENAALNSNAQYIEIQLRTRLQHAWATAVEAVGMVRGEDLKSGQGNGDWLRFFALMASEIAAEEGGVVVPNTPASDADRRQEIVALEKGLNALESLENYRKAVKISESAATYSPFFLIQFDPQANQVTVRGVSPGASVTSLDVAEASDKLNSVLVAVDKVSDLRAAYPNYFMDVGLFADQLRKVVKPVRKRAGGDWLAAWNEWRRR